MHLAIEFATVSAADDTGDRSPLWIANGPVACELDLYGAAGNGGDERPLCVVLVRLLARLLTAEESPFGFVPHVEETRRAWQVGLRLDRVLSVEVSAPDARLEPSGGEHIIVGDAAYRVVLTAERDSITLRTDRAGIEALAAACHSASRRLRAS